MRTVIRARRRTSLKRTILKFAAAALVLLFIIGLIVFSPKDKYSFSGKALVKLEISPQDQAVSFGKGAAYINSAEGNLYYLGENGKRVWAYNGAVKDMKLVASENRLAAYVATKLQMIGKDGVLIFSRVYDYPIQKLSMGNDICVILQYPEGTASNLLVLDNGGNVIDTLAEQTNQRLIDFGTYGSNGVWVITVDTGGISPEYKFSTYKYDTKKKITVSHNESSQIIYRPVFSEDTISLIGSDELVTIDLSGKELSRVCTVGYEYLSASLTPKTGDVIFARLDAQGKRPDTLNELLCVNSAGTAFKINTQQPVLDCAITKDYYYVFTKYSILRYDKKKLGMKEYNVPQPVNALITGKDNHVLLVCDQNVYKLTLS